MTAVLKMAPLVIASSGPPADSQRSSTLPEPNPRPVTVVAEPGRPVPG